MRIVCRCPAAQLVPYASTDIDSSLGCLERNVCWHIAALKMPSVFQFLVSKAAASGDPISGLPVTDVVCIISAHRSVADEVTAIVPQRLHVYWKGHSKLLAIHAVVCEKAPHPCPRYLCASIMLQCIVAPIHRQHVIITSSNKCFSINSQKL